jgi:hypothetical protein
MLILGMLTSTRRWAAASLSPERSSSITAWTAPAALREHLRELATDGWLPPWDR